MLRIDWTFQGGIPQRLHLHDGVIQHDAAIEQITGEIQNDFRDGVAARVETMWSTSPQALPNARARLILQAFLLNVKAQHNTNRKKDNVSLHTQSTRWWSAMVGVRVQQQRVASKHLAHHRLVCFFIRPRP
jgi:hypothetical protein